MKQENEEEVKCMHTCRNSCAMLSDALRKEAHSQAMDGIESSFDSSSIW